MFPDPAASGGVCKGVCSEDFDRSFAAVPPLDFIFAMAVFGVRLGTLGTVVSSPDPSAFSFTLDCVCFVSRLLLPQRALHLQWPASRLSWTLSSRRAERHD